MTTMTSRASSVRTRGGVGRLRELGMDCLVGSYGRPNLFRMHGFRPSEITPSEEHVVAHCHPDDRDRVRQAVAELGQTGRLPELRYRYILPDGTVRHLKSTVVSAADADGRSRKLVGTVQDVTDRRQAQRSWPRASPSQMRSLTGRPAWPAHGVWSGIWPKRWSSTPACCGSRATMPDRPGDLASAAVSLAATRIGGWRGPPKRGDDWPVQPGRRHPDPGRGPGDRGVRDPPGVG